MKIKSFTKKAVCVALLAGASFGAYAANTDLGTPVPGGAPVLLSGGAGPGGGFNDTFSFELLANGGSGYSVAELFIPALPDLRSKMTTLSLWTNPDNSLGFGTGSGGDDEVALKIETYLSGVPSISFTMAALTPGYYLLGVQGFVSGSIGGAYQGAISVSAPPVPEPESYAMFLAGLGLMGVIVRRRMRSQS